MRINTISVYVRLPKEYVSNYQLLSGPAVGGPFGERNSYQQTKLTSNTSVLKVFTQEQHLCNCMTNDEDKRQITLARLIDHAGLRNKQKFLCRNASTLGVA